MTTCTDCLQHLRAADGCTRGVLVIDDVEMVRRPYGSEQGWDIRPDRCHDCGALRDRPHHLGCCVERCPACAGQLVSCFCRVSRDPRFAPDRRAMPDDAGDDVVDFVERLRRRGQGQPILRLHTGHQLLLEPGRRDAAETARDRFRDAAEASRRDGARLDLAAHRFVGCLPAEDGRPALWAFVALDVPGRFDALLVDDRGRPWLPKLDGRFRCGFRWETLVPWDAVWVLGLPTVRPTPAIADLRLVGA